MIRETMDGPLALRALSQGEGEAAKAAGFDKNPFNADGPARRVRARVERVEPGARAKPDHGRQLPTW